MTKRQKRIVKQLLKDIEITKDIYKKNEAIRSYVRFTQEIRDQEQF